LKKTAKGVIMGDIINTKKEVITMSKWVTSWGIPTSYTAEGVGNLLKDTTFRNVFYNPIKGEKTRIRFSNKYGSENVTLDRVTIAEWAGKGPEIIADTLTEVTFKNNGNIIKAGEELLSDEIDFALEPRKKYVISYYFKDVTPVETGYHKYAVAGIAPCWLARGNYTDSINIPAKKRIEVSDYVFLCGVDALSSDDTHSVMAFGDSITARPWPDYLAQKLNDEGITNCSVVRKAIGGNRILRDYRNCLPRRRQGYAAIERFEMSLRQTLGVDRVVMLEGVNDILHPVKGGSLCDIDELPTSEEMIEGYKQCCDIAHKYGAKFYLCTLMPTDKFEQSEEDRNGIKEEINNWIRTNNYIDGYVDFEAAVKDKDHPTVLAKEFDDDGLHPNLEGSKTLCNTIPLEYIL
jgi:lysophospholipase L1-like esterase